MKINEKFISIPPYLSVSWREVSSLQKMENNLFIRLKSGDVVLIPDLSAEDTQALFQCHRSFLEQEESRLLPQLGPQLAPQLGPQFGRLPFPFPLDPLEMATLGEHPIAFKIGTPDGIISALAHNAAQAKAPSLPPDLLDKFAGITEIIDPNDLTQLPLGVAECNCYFCQIMNRLHQECPLMKEDEIITEKDLQFREWLITQTGEKLFSVENPLDSADKHSVYLGHPVGCSCGKEGCEHIIAVLKS